MPDRARVFSVLLHQPGCGAMIPAGFSGAAARCQARPTHVGVALHTDDGTGPPRPRGPELYRVFTCAEHAWTATGARPLLDRDARALAEAGRRHDDAMAGRPWQRPEPLARGAEARTRFQAAERAAAGNAERPGGEPGA